MSNLVFAAIMPHGDYIPELGGPNPSQMAKTHKAALRIERLVANSHPDTIVIATPHGNIVDGYICVGSTEIASGTLQGAKGSIEANITTDRSFAESLLDCADLANLPVADYVADPDGESVLPLDWGAIMPLWYCGLRSGTRYKYVIVSPSNSVHPAALLDFGKCISDVGRAIGRRVAFIASCDWAHAHDVAGPYGYHPDAKNFDTAVSKIISENRLMDLTKIDSKMIDNALADGIPQALMLQGAIDGANFHAELLSYERPTYFGMLVASFTR